MPSLRSASISAQSSWRTCGSSPTVGSSSRTSRGWWTSARAIRSRRRIPPESSSTRAPRRSTSFASSSARWIASRRSARPNPVEVREDEQVLLDRERDVEVVELRRDAELRPRLLRLLRQREAEQLQLALVGDRLRGQQAHRRRLAGAVRAEQADARALGHVEIESVDGGDLAVALDDTAEPDRELGQMSPSTERMFPAGSLNQAIVGPRPSPPRAIPFSSCSKPS